MPPCKNDSKGNYSGDEPSPKGLGFCAHAEKEETIKKGKDGNFWIVSGGKWIKNALRYLIKSGSDNDFNFKNKVHEEFFFAFGVEHIVYELMSMFTVKKVGSLELPTNKLIIADPCYHDSKVKSGLVNSFKTKKDKYDVFELKYSDKNYIKFYFISDGKPDRDMCDDKKTKKFNIPVDAGMISFMDESFYGNSSITKTDFYDFFRGFYSPSYDAYCVMTL